MKTLSLYLGILYVFAFAMPVDAQVRIGVMGGYNKTDVSFVDLGYDVTESRSATGFGGTIGMGMGHWVAFSIEPMIISKGARGLKTSYVDIPVLLKISLMPTAIRPYVVLGPSVGYLRSARLSGAENEDIKKFMEEQEWGVIAGAGFRIPVNRLTVFVEGRYAYGLRPIFKEVDVLNKGMQIMTGVTISL